MEPTLALTLKKNEIVPGPQQPLLRHGGRIHLRQEVGGFRISYNGDRDIGQLYEKVLPLIVSSEHYIFLLLAESIATAAGLTVVGSGQRTPGGGWIFEVENPK